MLIDIDHFKHVNDTYGHAIGDTVLAQVGKLLKNAVRESDFVLRWGGEEFLIILRNCDLNKIANVAEQIRSTCEKEKIQIDTDKTLNISVSIGYAPYPFAAENPSLYQWEDVIKLADCALYSAKENQRNAWVGFIPGTSSSPKQAVISDIQTAIDTKEMALQTNLTQLNKIQNKGL